MAPIRMCERTPIAGAALLLCAGAMVQLVTAAPVPTAVPRQEPCTAAGECTDNTGQVWDLGSLGRVHRVAGTYDAGSGPRPDTFTYVFRLYANLADFLLPDICTSSGVETASAVRYDPVQHFPGGPPPSCAQIGPDMSEQPTYTVRRVPMGLTFNYQFAGSETLEINLRCLEGAGVGLPTDALWDQQNPGQYTINWLNGITCPGINPPCTTDGACTDDEGEVWQLASLRQIQRVAGPIAGKTYAFRLYANLNLVPDPCREAGVTTASAMRYDSGECAQIGPDMAFDPTYRVQRAPDGLFFQYQLDDTAIRVHLVCREVSGLPRPVAPGWC